MDNQQEKCPFYQSIHQFNGMIRNELIRDIKIYSGSIISLKDIKFELFKRVNRFFFVDLKTKTETDALFSLSSELITFNLLSFMDKIDFTNIEKRLSSLILFLIFHEVCGHFKTNINNQLIENSPSYHLDENLNLIYRDFGLEDSGFIFESILTGNVIDCNAMLKDPKSEELFDIKLYIQDNFTELQKKIEEFSPNITTNTPKVKYDDKTKKTSDITKTIQTGNDELPQELIDKLNEVEKNLDKYNYNRLYPIFRVPEGMTKQRFKELLKDNVVYKKFLKVLPADDEKY